LEAEVNLTNLHNLPRPLVDAWYRQHEAYHDGRGESDITVTQLIDPPQKVELERRHAEEIGDYRADRAGPRTEWAY